MDFKTIKFIDALIDALGRSDEQSTEEVLADIRDDGIDADTVLASLHKFRLDIANRRYPKIGEPCPDCGEILKDTPEDHSLWCGGRDDFNIEIVRGSNGLKRVVFHKKQNDEPDGLCSERTNCPIVVGGEPCKGCEI